MPANTAVVFCLCVGIWEAVAGAPIARAQIKVNARIVTDVQLVQMPVVIFDDKGAVAANLGKNDFRILEDGVEQRILYCERERVPVSFVVLADVSSSMTKKIPFVQEAALSLLDPPERENQYADEFSIISIETRARPLVPFSRDRLDLEGRLPLLLSPTNGSTALFDGIYFGVSTAQRRAANDHSAVIVISDGGDNHSRYSLRDTKRFLEEADVPVFAVMAGPSFELPQIFLKHEKKKPTQFPKQDQAVRIPELPIPIPGDDYIGAAERRGPSNLKTLTEASGGGVFTAREQEDLPRIVRTIGLAVRYQYLLTYRPNREKGSEATPEKVENNRGWHKIHLELYPKEKFRGYSLPYYKTGYRSIE
jgi:VWFA-related protein